MVLLYACEAAVTEDEVETSECSCELNDGLFVTLEDLIDGASDAITLISGGLVTGRCEVTVRPCSTGGCACRGRGCACCAIEGIPLRGFRPEVTEVKIDGAIVPTSEWAIANGRVLVRLNGERWPTSQNILLPDTEDKTFSVAYESGVPFDFVSKMAAIELICEMAASLSGRKTRLPKGTVSATADGVQIVIGRLPGQEEVTAVGLTWLGRFLAFYGVETQTVVRSPELDDGWVLHQVTFNP